MTPHGEKVDVEDAQRTAELFTTHGAFTGNDSGSSSYSNLGRAFLDLQAELEAERAAARLRIDAHQTTIDELEAARKDNAQLVLTLAEAQGLDVEVERLRKALDAAMQYVDPKDRDWIEALASPQPEGAQT